MKIQSLVLIVALVSPAAALADGAGGTSSKTAAAKAAKLQPDDIKLVTHLHHVNMMEVDMGKLAQRSGGAAVKRYGGQLVKDHQQNDAELTAFAARRGLAKIPMEAFETEAAQKEHQDAMSTMARLQTLKGGEFDREFLLAMVMDHDREVGRNEVAVASARDTDLQGFLRDVRPVLQRHADAARELQKSANAVSTGGTTSGDASRGGAQRPRAPSTGNGSASGGGSTQGSGASTTGPTVR